jgi:hypothetical protein
MVGGKGQDCNTHAQATVGDNCTGPRRRHRAGPSGGAGPAGPERRRR